MADWYYTTNKQQMGPVSLQELQQLANKGLLRPTDLVWKDGMRDWAQARSQDLFGAGEAASESEAPTGDEEDDRHHRRVSRADEDDGPVERPRRRRPRRRDDGMPVGLKAGLIVGGAVVLLLVAGISSYFLLRPGPGTFTGSLNAADLRDPVMGGPSRVYPTSMVQGRTYVIDLRSAQFDSFLRLEDSAFRELARDDDGGGGLNARIVFRCPRTDNYRIIATSLGQGQGAYTLTIREN